MFPSNKNIDGSNIDLTNYYTKTEVDTIINSQGQAYIPCGSVQAFMTTTAPKGYLVCDGTEYLKSDYPQLANVLNTVDTTQGTTNFVGSDSNHFKVPDLRGEFLRGSGTNSHTNQGNGANVGVHQDGTTVSGIYVDTNNRNYLFGLKARNNADAYISSNGRAWSPYNNSDSENSGTVYTIRPTNTSVLYCIAYQDLYMTPLHQYSTDEHVVGTWIDGKPLYEKVVVSNIINTYDDDKESAQLRTFTIDLSNVIPSDAKIMANLSNPCVKIEAGTYYVGNEYCTPFLPLADGTSSVGFGILNNSLIFRCAKTWNITAISAYIILCYTKTTDL